MRVRAVVEVAVVLVVLVSGCSSSTPAPSVSRVESALSRDASVGSFGGLVPAGKLAQVRHCLAVKLHSSADSGDLAGFVRGQRTLAQVRVRGGDVGQLSQACVRSAISG